MLQVEKGGRYGEVRVGEDEEEGKGGEGGGEGEGQGDYRPTDALFMQTELTDRKPMEEKGGIGAGWGGLPSST